MLTERTDNNNPDVAVKWDPVVTEFYSVLYKLALYLINRQTYKGFSYSAAGLVQKTFERAIRYRPDPDAIDDKPAYLKTTLKRLWFDILSKEKGLIIVSLEIDENDESPAFEMPDLRVDIQASLENEELLNIIRTDPGSLNDNEYRLFVLFLKDYSCDEIAATLNTDVRIVRYDLNKLRTKIIQRFQKRFKVKGQYA